MKEIGEKLKEARESIGVSLEEAATDLKTTAKQLQNIEEGKMEAFKDVLNLKYLIRDYAKYLGLNKDDMVDEFNEYIFDYTSKISLEDISNAKKKKEKTTKKEEVIKSPYTTIKEKKKINYCAIIVCIVVLTGIGVATYFYIDIHNKQNTNIISYVERK